jgi:O-antigen/teichoic acid export membrane protein
MRSGNRAIVNTFILYGRLILTIGVSLFSTRIVLNALGVENYGIFTLIAGVISMLTFLNAALSTSTQRFLSFYQGKSDLQSQKRVFANSFVAHVAIGAAIVIILQIVGYFIFDGFLNIPVNKIHSAKVIFNYMSITVFFTIIMVPFSGTLYAHENMLWIALVAIIETILKLAIAFILLNASSEQDNLVLYGMLTASVGLVTFMLYAGYCFRCYSECTFKLKKNFDKIFLVELGSFASYNLFGALCVVGRIEGVAILLNIFFGSVINASFGIANQVAGQINFLSSTLLQAINPQIMKSEGSGDRERMLRLAMIASKFSFFLLSLVAIPFIFEMSSILQLWLNDVPSNSTIFCQLILIGTMINQLTVGLQSAIQATGKIKVYQTVIGSVILLNLPLGYLLLKAGFPAFSILAAYMVLEVFACTLRVYFLRKLAGLSIRVFCRRVIFRLIIPVLLSILTCVAIISFVELKYRFCLTVCLSSLSLLVSFYFFGLCSDEKDIITNFSSKILLRLSNFRSKNGNNLL